MNHTTTTRPSTTRTRTASIWCLIDRSGSMESIREDVVGGFDSFLADQRGGDTTALVTVAQFDTQDPYEIIINRLPVDRVPSIRRAFRPRGGTPLFDAIGSLLDHAERTGRGEDRLIVIITDGQENASRRWDRDALFARIARLRERGWTFVFIGANQDSYTTGRALGFGHGSVSNFVGDAPGAHIACESLSRATREWRSKDSSTRRRDEGRFFGDRKEAEEDLRRRSAAKPRTKKSQGWATGVGCRTHGIAWCPDCKPRETDVIVVAGGSAYHRTVRCQALIEGQRSIERKGGQPSPIQAIRLSTAKAQARSACLVCRPEP